MVYNCCCAIGAISFFSAVQLCRQLAASKSVKNTVSAGCQPDLKRLCSGELIISK
jgi:hypothetical protein